MWRLEKKKSRDDEKRRQLTARHVASAMYQRWRKANRMMMKARTIAASYARRDREHAEGVVIEEGSYGGGVDLRTGESVSVLAMMETSARETGVGKRSLPISLDWPIRTTLLAKDRRVEILGKEFFDRDDLRGSGGMEMNQCCVRILGY